jgi:benzoyl-CoA reductase/2-hydroxyglutaryl-CoA dehydratase subunit BcrC/BadD/HgdB
MEILSLKGKRIIPFGYPHAPNKNELKKNIEKLASDLGATIDEAQRCKTKLDEIRSRVKYLDELLWKDNKALGDETRLVELSCTDFESSPESFCQKVERAIAEIEPRAATQDTIRLGICGVPPIITNLYSHLERNGCRVVFSEVERQFSIPYTGETLEEAYSLYTYPYGIFERIKDITQSIIERKIDGIIHYVQSFCFRGIEDIALRQSLAIPVLTIQGDLPTRVTETQEIRLEAFIDMLTRRKTR